MKRNVSVVRFKFRCNILISGKIIKEMPVSVASGTHYTYICIYIYIERERERESQKEEGKRYVEKFLSPGRQKARSGLTDNLFGPPARADQLKIFTIWSDRVDLYNHHVLTLPRNTKNI